MSAIRQLKGRGRRWAGSNQRLVDYRNSSLQMRARLARPGVGPRIFVNSVPKAGTHLLMSALDAFPAVRISGMHLRKRLLLLDHSELVESNPNVDWQLVHRLLSERAKRGQYVTAHFWGYEELFDILNELEYAPLFVVRDPRDTVVSLAAYEVRLRRQPSHFRFVHEFRTDQERYLAIINGYGPSPDGPGRVSLRDSLEGFRPWLTAPGVLCCRFEDLTGSRGGGSSAAQVHTIMAIGAHIGQPLTTAGASEIANKAWSPASATFRAGVTGEWRDRFDQETLDAFDRAIDDELLGAFGYER